MLEELQKSIDHRFRREALLCEALRQSVEAPAEPGIRNNALLAWFGDRIVGFMVTEALYSSAARVESGLPDIPQQQKVKNPTLAEAAKALGLDGQIVDSKGRKMPAYQLSTRALAKAYEAVVAAIYIDAGLEKARDFVRSTLKLEPASAIPWTL